MADRITLLPQDAHSLIPRACDWIMVIYSKGLFADMIKITVFEMRRLARVIQLCSNQPHKPLHREKMVWLQVERCRRRESKQIDEATNFETGEGLEPLLLTLKMKEGGYEPRNVVTSREQLSANIQQGNRSSVAQPPGIEVCQWMDSKRIWKWIFSQNHQKMHSSDTLFWPCGTQSKETSHAYQISALLNCEIVNLCCQTAKFVVIFIIII